MKRIKRLALCLCLITAIWAADAGTKGIIRAEGGALHFTRTKTVLTAGKSFTFRAKGSSPVRWSVSDKKRAVISKKGKLTGKRAGRVEVIASAGTESIRFTVKIKGKKRIALDPGHQQYGDSHTEPAGPGSAVKKARVAGGTRGAATGVPEYKLTLSIAKKVKADLLDRGYEVVMTREKNNVNISNRERALLANESGADICVRIHADGAASASAAGASALYPSSRNPYVGSLSKKSLRLAGCVLDSFCAKTGAKKRGTAARDDLTGTNWSEIPVIVIEMGFMTNPAEDRSMQTEGYQNKMAAGIADGIDCYYGT